MSRDLVELAGRWKKYGSRCDNDESCDEADNAACAAYQHCADELSALLAKQEGAVAWVYEFSDPDPQVDVEFGEECPAAWKSRIASGSVYPLYTHPSPVVAPEVKGRFDVWKEADRIGRGELKSLLEVAPAAMPTEESALLPMNPGGPFDVATLFPATRPSVSAEWEATGFRAWLDSLDNPMLPWHTVQRMEQAWNAALALRQTGVREEMREVVAFLLGEQSLDGVWYGEKHSSGKPYWWRSRLRAALSAAIGKGEKSAPTSGGGK